MAGFHFAIMYGMSFVLISCKGKIISPPDGTKLTILPGSSKNITWNYDGNPVARAWFFTSSDGPHSSEIIAQINKFGVNIDDSILPGIAIIQPATLSLKNVNRSYDGTFKFSINQGAPEEDSSNVRVYIAKKPNVTMSCSSSVTLNEGDNFTCTCRGRGGNPPANVTWYKDDVQIGETKTENNTLILIDVGRTDSGLYKCVAQSYPTDEYKDVKSIEIIVKSKPYNTIITLEPRKAVVGETVKIECESNGFPGVNYSITHVETKKVRYLKMFTIPVVKLNDTGTYKCFVWNEVGNDSDSANLTIEERSTQPSPKTPISTSEKPTNGITAVTRPSEDPTEPPPPIPIVRIVVPIICALLLVIIVVVVIYCYKKKQKAKRNGGNIDPVAGNHYELDEEPGAGDNAYDSVGPVGASSSKSKPPEKNTLPPVYAAVDKNNRQGNTLYASLDTDAMKPKRESKKEPERTPQTEYASIDFAKRADDNVPKADLV